MRVYFVNAEIYTTRPARWINTTYTSVGDEHGETIIATIRDGIAAEHECDPFDVRIVGIFKL